MTPLGALDLYLNRVAIPAGQELKISDIARVKEGFKSLPDVRLNLSPHRLALIPPRVISEALTVSTGESLIIIGTRSSVIPLKWFPVEKSWFYQQLLTFLDNADGHRDGRMEVEVLEEPLSPQGHLSPQGRLAPQGRVLIPAEQVRFNFVRENRRHGYLAGRIDVSCSLGDPDRPEGLLKLLVHQWVLVPQLAQSVRENEVLSAGKIKFVERDLSLVEEGELSDKLFELRESPARYAARRDLPRGAFIRDQDISPVKGLKAGEEIRIVFRKGNVRLEMAGRANRSGDIGDAVPVYLRNTQKRFIGIVTGPSEVEVEIP